MTVAETLVVEDAVYEGDIDTVADMVRVTDSGMVPVLAALRVSLVVTVDDADTQLLVVGEAVDEEVAESVCDVVTVGHEVDVADIEYVGEELGVTDREIVLVTEPLAEEVVDADFDGVTLSEFVVVLLTVPLSMSEAGVEAEDVIVTEIVIFRVGETDDV